MAAGLKIETLQYLCSFSYITGQEYRPRTLKTEYWKTSNQIEDIEMIVRSFEPDAESISQKRQRASKKRRIKLRVKPIVYKRVN